MAAAPIKRALISVSDKTGIVEFAKALVEFDVELISTGGTSETLREAGLVVCDVSELTGFPEIMDGRVKTLHPKIHGGLLSIRDNASHAKAQADHGIDNIDLLVVNLYPFEKTVEARADFATTIENIDIGGPAMIRAAAKNHAFVSVVVDADDYPIVVAEMKKNDGATSLELRRRLAAKAYARTGAYDSAISQWFATQVEDADPAFTAFGGNLIQAMRYGENPHQRAWFYKDVTLRPGVASARQVQGKELSYNNINDTDAAYECVCEFDPAEEAAVVIVKHANPCGVAASADLSEAYQKALMCDPVSAFGGIVALNRPIDKAVAERIVEVFTEVIIAPDADEGALEVIAQKPNVRLLLAGALPDPGSPGKLVKSVAGGLLVQDRDYGRTYPLELKVVSKRQPNPNELADLLFAFKVCKHVKSNAIVYARDKATVGVGAGQMSRIDSARIAALKSAEAAEAAGKREPLSTGSVAASDAFFPFADGLLKTADAGATAVIQPGGSMRDDEVIAAADKADLAMVFTGMRHFRH